jgi:membrane protease YdiL (CAAX protease family)
VPLVVDENIMSEQNGEPPPIASPVPPGAIHAGVPMAQPTAPTMPRIGNAIVGWLLVLILVGGGVFFQNLVRPALADEAEKKGAKQDDGGGKPIVLEMQMRLLVGLYEASLADKNADEAAKTKMRESLTTQIDALDHGSVDQRLRAIIALGEVAGYVNANGALADLKRLIEKEGVELSKGDAERLDVLTRLYGDYADGRPDAPTVSPEERAMLHSRLGWFGALALANPNSPQDDSKRLRPETLDSAERSGNALILLFIVGGCALAIGVISLVTLTLLYLWRRKSAHPMHTRLGPPVPHHAVYVETFAVAAILFAGLNVAAHEVPVRNMMQLLAVQGAAMFLTLAALAWPVMRGVPWRQVRRDVGLTAGMQPLLEPTAGVLTYCMALPFAMVGISCVVVLMLLKAANIDVGGVLGLPFGPAAPAGPGVPAPGNSFTPDPSITHPVFEFLAYGSVTELIAVLVLAAVIAPIVEETLFRGVLYRHLRDATRPAGLLSIVLSAFVVNTIFAVVHPQGLIAAPALAALACGFVVGREWRGTLIPSMLAHGINNAIMVTLVYNLLH